MDYNETLRIDRYILSHGGRIILREFNLCIVVPRVPDFQKGYYAHLATLLSFRQLGTAVYLTNICIGLLVSYSVISGSNINGKE